MSEIKNKVPTFNHHAFNSLNKEVQETVKQLVDNNCKDIKLSKYDFLNLVDFLTDCQYLKTDFLPIFRRYLFNYRHDHPFMKTTAYIHRNREWLDVEDMKTLYLIILHSHGMLQDITKDNEYVIPSINILKNIDHPDAIYLYASILEDGSEEHKSRRLFRLNWENNRHSDSLHSYAYMLQYGIGGPKDEVKAKELYLLNWDENRHSNSLHQYAYCLENGIGGPKDEARRLYKLNWDENRHSNSLHQYAILFRKWYSRE